MRKRKKYGGKSKLACNLRYVSQLQKSALETKVAFRTLSFWSSAIHLSTWSSPTHLQSRFILCSDHPYVYAQWRFPPLLISLLRFSVTTLVSARIMSDSRGPLSDSILVLWCPTKQSPGPFLVQINTIRYCKVRHRPRQQEQTLVYSRGSLISRVKRCRRPGNPW